MKLNIHLKLFIITIGFTGLSGCATIEQGKVIDSDTVKIETHRSPVANIGKVTVYQQGNGYLIKGKVTRNIMSRSHIRGHLDIELLNPQGKVVFETSTRYQHSGLRFNKEKFSLVINKAITKGSLLRITHIESDSHRQ